MKLLSILKEFGEDFYKRSSFRESIKSNVKEYKFLRDHVTIFSKSGLLFRFLGIKLINFLISTIMLLIFMMVMAVIITGIYYLVSGSVGILKSGEPIPFWLAFLARGTVYFIMYYILGIALNVIYETVRLIRIIVRKTISLFKKDK